MPAAPNYQNQNENVSISPLRELDRVSIEVIDSMIAVALPLDIEIDRVAARKITPDTGAD